ncbi:MAG TPA: SRPBCC domain-containing protein [Acidimicrobiales bacterium]|nr:SRPBCC domain-containing protein [Acidimicrobiales bacterium]
MADDVRILGRLRVEEGEGVVRVEDRVVAPASAVWSALTDPERLAQWYGEVEGDLRVGGRYRARLYASGWEGNGLIETCDPRRRLVVVSAESGDPADGRRTTVELVADGDSTVVAVEHTGVPVEYLFAFGAGVQIHLEDLVAHVTGAGPVARERSREDTDARFDELEPPYRDLAEEARARADSGS